MKFWCRLMLVYVAEKILSKAALGFLRNPEGAGFPGSRNFNNYPAASNPELIAGYRHALGRGCGLYRGDLRLYPAAKHMLGFQIKLAGQAPRAARFHGVNPNRLVVLCMGISGALAGLAGLFEVTGPPARSASTSTWAMASPPSSWPSLAA